MNYETITLQANPTNVLMSEDHIARLNELETLRKEIVTQFDAYTTDQLTFKPEPTHWNLLQVLDHIVTSERHRRSTSSDSSPAKNIRRLPA